MRKLLSLILLPVVLITSILPANLSAVTTNDSTNPWTREKATRLARAVLFDANPATVDALVQAGNASSAVNLLFPSVDGPDRSAYDSFLTNYTSSGFSWTDAYPMIRYYQLSYALDPYEAKRKFFSMFEDIFSVNPDTGRGIGYRDIVEQHSLIYANMFGSYETLVKKLLYNNGGRGDFAEGAYLDLFNQKDPKNPNENYARELLQLFLMGEYEPFKSLDNNDTRNYEESDVKALARILTGLRADATTHAITFDVNNHYAVGPLAFLTGSIAGTPPPYYNIASGTIDPTAIITSTAGNNGLTDNVIEYIFAKRSDQIALFLADRMYRFYVSDTPTRAELDTIATMIKNNNFDMFASVKAMLAMDLAYTDRSMNSLRYKNPLELAIGTIKLLQNNDANKIALDPNIYDVNLLRRLNWIPYFPGSVFGRDGFDDSAKWSNTSILNAWMSATNYFVYRNGTGAVDLRAILGSPLRKTLTTESIPVFTSSKNNFTGTLTLISGNLETATNSIALTSLAEIGSGTLTASSTDTNTGTLAPSFSATGTIPNTASGDTAFTGMTGTFLENGTGAVVSNTQTGTTATGEVVTSSGDIFMSTESSTTATATGENTTTSGALTHTTTDMNTGATATGTTAAATGETLTNTLTTATQSVLDASSTNTPIPTNTFATANTDTLISLANLGSPTITITSGSVLLPSFAILTDKGTLTFSGGTYDASTQTLHISSGTLTQSGTSTLISSGTLIMSPSAVLTADIVTADTILNTMRQYLLRDVALPSSVITTMKNFLTSDDAGNPLPITPTANEYYDRKIRGLASLILSQPEYVLLTGADASTVVQTDDQHLLDTTTSKLIFVELYGGNDYLSSIIPKDEYSTYVDYRTLPSGSGTIALPLSSLTDIGDFYMNNALAYGSGGLAGFKSVYDEGALRLFNRIGAYRQSQDHDAAEKQISSYDESTNANAEGVYGHLIRREANPVNTMSLGPKNPSVLRGGQYVNIGGNVVLTNPLSSTATGHMLTLASLAQSRSYPGNVANVFGGAARISDIAKVSVSAGGPSGANGDMNNIFNFTKILLNNNIGKTFYMMGYGGYDTHDNQFPGLNNNLNTVSTAVTKFFNEVKDTQDITIVVFSEFGRTNKVNSSLGTDHGNGGGMYVLTSNPTLKSLLPNATYGNMSIKNAKANNLGVGIDYRSVYGKIFQALYGVDGKSYFNDQSVSFENDTSLAPNEISLFSITYEPSGATGVTIHGEYTVTGANYNPGKAGYTAVYSGTGADTKNKPWQGDGKLTPNGWKHNFDFYNAQTYYRLDSFSNQYVLTTLSGNILDANRPVKLAWSVRTPSYTGASIISMFAYGSVPRTLAGSGIVLATGAMSVTPPQNSDFTVTFASGTTQVNDLTYVSGSVIWYGGFAFGEKVNPDFFIPRSARITTTDEPLVKNKVTRIVKLGADRLGIGMRLSQPIELTFKNISDSGAYRIVTSEDGVNWADLETAGKTYTRDVNNNIIAPTPHLSYFALVGTDTTSGSDTGSGNTNTGSTATGSTNTGSTNTGSTSTGSTASGSTNTGSGSGSGSGATSTGSTATGSTNTGSTSGNTGTGEFTHPATLADFTGRTITVGVGKDYPTLALAVAGANSGDKIYLDEGVYPSDYTVIVGKNLAIIGLGSGAELKKVAPIPNAKAIIVSNTSNLYIENIIFSDATVPDKNGAGIRYEGGTLTIVNSTFQHNENGILGGATPIGQGSIWIDKSKFLDNGANASGYTHSIYIGEMEFFQITNSVVRGTLVGHHIKSRARNNVIENNTLDDAGKNTSYNIDLPNGGNALVRGNTLIQSEASPNRVMLSYSAEKNPPNAGTLTVENNTFVSSGATAIGVKNFQNNPVILRNNTFVNVSTPYVGNNISVDNTGSGSGNTNTGSTATGSTASGSTNTGSTNTGSGSSSGSGSTSTGSTATGSTNTGSTSGNTGTTTPVGNGGTSPSVSGPGGASYTPPTRGVDFCPNGDFSGNNSDGKCNPATIDNTVPMVIPIYQNNTIHTVLADIEMRSGDSLTLRDRQVLLQLAMAAWREAVHPNPTIKNTRLQQLFANLQDEARHAKKTSTKEAISLIFNHLTRLQNDSQKTTTDENIGEENTQASEVFRYVNALHALTLRSSDRVSTRNILAYLARNDRVQVLTEVGNWTRVLWGDVEGYVKSTYLRDETTADRIRAGTLAPENGREGNIAVANANIRRGAGMGYAAIAIAHENDTVTFLDEVGGWLEVMWNGMRGWVAKRLVKE